MKKKVKLITESIIIDELMTTYFATFQGYHFLQALKCFSRKSGYGENFLFIMFKNDVEEYGTKEDNFDLPYEIDDNHIVLGFYYMGSDEIELAYIDFITFYNYIYNQAMYEMEKSQTIDFTLLLSKVRVELLGA